MSGGMRRIKKIETESSLTPKQIILLWFQEAHAFNTIEEYVRYLKTQPDSAAPIDRLTSQVYESVKQTLGRRSREEINKAVNQGYKDVLFLFYLHQRINGKLFSENRYYWTKWLMLSKELQSLLREQEQNRQMRWNRIRVELEMPYPLDVETATAIEAAKQHHVITWEVLEEGDDIGEWVRESFVAEGKIPLPDGAYFMRSGTTSSHTTVPTEEEVRGLFQGVENYRMFLEGEDYSNGLADVPDAEYDAHYEAIVNAVKDAVQPGAVVDLPYVPHAFLREAPLIDGNWIDLYVVELAEWGSRLVEQGYLLVDPEDQHPMAWQKIINKEDGSDADAAVSTKLWQQTRKQLLTFPGRARVIDEREYLSFRDYLKWKGRRNGDLKAEARNGLAVSPWNKWVEAQGGQGVATLAGVQVSKLSTYMDSYRYRACRDAEELVEEVSQRKSLLESLQIGKPGSDDEERFRRRIEQWKESALGFLPEIYTLRRAVDQVSQRYFEAQETLFRESSEGLDQLIASSDKLVGIYNETLAEDIGRLERLLNETGDWQDESPLTVDLAGLIESVQGDAKAQIAYMVDMAKADALDLLGETRQALELVDRHV